MPTKEIISALQGLSEVQRQAAEWNEGPLLVLAGPGSGKTRVLAGRIARILDSTRAERFRILGLTFTNKAADEMRTRVGKFVPGEESRLFLGTFHSFCADVLRQHGIHLGINPNFRVYAQDSDLQAVLDDAVREAEKTSPLASKLDKQTLPVIQRLKANLVPPEACREVFRDSDFAERMAIIYPAYEKELTKRNALDFNSLIFQTHRLFTKFPTFAKRYRSVYAYICVDEFQDTNQAQYGLIRVLTGNDYRNLFVVADDDQIIYQWNGASHKRLEDFVRDYSPRVIQLPTNYRCPPEVVALANNLIRHNFLRSAGKQPLEAAKPVGGGSVVRLLPSFPNPESEAHGVATDIATRHAGELASVVILARNRKLLQGAARGLHEAKIPAVISQRKDDFTSTPFVWLNAMLRLASNKQDRASLETLCGASGQLTEINVDPDDVLTQAQGSGLGYLEQWIRVVSDKKPSPLAKEAVDEVRSFVGGQRDYRAFCKNLVRWFGKLIEAQKQSAGAEVAEVFSGYEEERSVWEQLVSEISASLGDQASLEAFLQELQLHSKEPPPKPNTVLLMSIHAAKGKEFEHVYLIGLVEDELPSFQSKQKGDTSQEMEEERRNCFVAVTRAVKTLTLSCAKEYRGYPKEPSRFLYEMGLLTK